MARVIKKTLRKVQIAVEKEITDNANHGGPYAHGLASEGYAGGYRDAIQDVCLLLNGCKPDGRGRDWWDCIPTED